MPDLKKNTKRFKWRCKHCGSIQISDPKIRHKMDYCDCGRSAIDAEEYYCRIMGQYEFIEELND